MHTSRQFIGNWPQQGVPLRKARGNYSEEFQTRLLASGKARSVTWCLVFDQNTLLQPKRQIVS
jgi:hypothetical protein